MSLYMRKPTIWVPTRSDTNRPVQSQKMVRGWKFWIKKVQELYYPCSENKGADQLRSYCKADLRLCFCLCRLLVFLCGGSYISMFLFSKWSILILTTILLKKKKRQQKSIAKVQHFMTELVSTKIFKI